MLMVLFVTATVTVAEKPCCYPEQYEGSIGLVSHSPGFQQSQLVMANYSVDYKNKRVASYEQTQRNGETMKMGRSAILDFKAKKQYSIIWEKRWCSACNISFPMPSRCALNNATFMGSTYFGVGASALATTAWRSDEHTLRHRIFPRAVVITQKNCVPMSEIVIGGIFLQIISYYNNTLGIQDPGVFTPPDFCKKEVQDCEREVMRWKQMRFSTEMAPPT